MTTPHIRAMREALEALVTNNNHAESGGMVSYQKGSATWQLWRDAEAILAIPKDNIEKLQLGFDRYEKLRRFTPRQFAGLYSANLLGNNFDNLVDAIAATKPKELQK